jgi:hypothetical protein
MSAHAGTISIRSSHSRVGMWRFVAVAGMLAVAAGSGAIVGRTTAPSTSAIPAVVPHVQVGTISSTRPLSDATFVIGAVPSSAGAPSAPRTDTPASEHARQVAR